MADVTDALDPDRLAVLRELDDGDGALLAAIVDEFERDAGAQLDTVRDAVARGDSLVVQQAAHRMKGASANLGAPRLAEACARLEQLGRSEQLGDAASLVTEVESELARVSSELPEALAEV